MRADTNLESLKNIGHVTGDVTIYMDERDQRDLSFLQCLHTIDGLLEIYYNRHLESTIGLQLSSVGRIIIRQNANLRTVVGFDRVTQITGLEFSGNPRVETLHFESLKRLTWLIIGGCDALNASAARNDALRDIAGFDSLVQIDWFEISGNDALTQLSFLDRLADNGGVILSGAYLLLNSNLPDSLVHQQLDRLGVPSRILCGNAESPDTPDCYCPLGE